MSVADNGSFPSLSEQFGHRPPSRSDSEDSVSQDERGPPLWPISETAYPPTFEDERSDDEVESMTSSTLTDRVPGLTRGSSIASSDRSAMQTDIASILQGGFVLESDDGVLTLPRYAELDADLLCPFQILDCAETFSSVREYKLHVFSHFRGHPLPTSAACFLCTEKFYQASEDDPALAWNSMLGHMCHDHFRMGQEFGTIRADFALMRWMYDRKIISDLCFKRAQICPVPTILPAAIRHASEAGSVVLPEAPSPPNASAPSSPSSVISTSPVSPRRSSYSNQPYVTFAGARAERRRRDSIRPVARHVRTMS